MLPSEIPRLATDPPKRVYPDVWKLLSFLRLPSWDGLCLYLFCLSFYLLYFVLPPFKDNGLLFWVPDVLCQHSEVFLWNLLGAQMFFQWICWWESGLPILFLCHLRTASPLNSYLYFQLLQFLKLYSGHIFVYTWKDILMWYLKG